MSTEHVHAPQLWEVVAERMRTAILSGELAAGTKLVERELATRFGTSRGPIREAIRELAREGLVAELPRRGTIVSTLTARDLAEVYGVREALEIGASKAVIGRASDDELRALERHLDAMESAWAAASGYLSASEHDLAFHRDLVALAANARLSAMAEQMLSTTALLLRTAAESHPTLRIGMDPQVHRRIVAALTARDHALAREAIEAHYGYAEERLFAGFGG